MRILFSILFIFSIGYLSGQNQHISFNTGDLNQTDTEPTRKVNDFGLDGVTVEYNFYDAIVHYKQEQNSFFHQFYIKNFTQTQEVGKPMLPVHTDLIYIPEGANFSIQLIDSSSTTYNNFLVYPTLQEQSDQFGTEEPPFEQDNIAYQSNEYYPNQKVILKGILNLRGLRFAMIEVHPIQYNTSNLQLRMNSTIKYHVAFTNSTQFINFQNNSLSFLEDIPNLPLNNQYLRIAVDHYIAQNQNQIQSINPTNYIILTHPQFKKAADSLARWKSQLGYNTEIITGYNWTDSNIQSTIQNKYNEHNVKPDYLVLLGDFEKIPAAQFINSENKLVHSDLYYSCMGDSTDFISDMAVGRIPVSDSIQAMQVIQKIINYEKSPSQQLSFYNNVSLVAHFKSQDGHYEGNAQVQSAENLYQYFDLKGYNGNRIYTAESNANPTNWNNDLYSAGEPIQLSLKKPNYHWTGNAYSIQQKFMEGQLIVLYRSDSWYGGWSNPQFNNFDLNLLNNGNKLPILFSLAGNSGDFTETNSFSKKLLQKQNGGAVAVFSQSNYFSTRMNNALSSTNIDAIWPSPGLIPNFQTVYQNGLPAANRTSVVELGEIRNQAIIKAIEIWGSDIDLIKRSSESFNLQGDPAMKIWTSIPTPIIASTNSTINCVNDTQLTIYSNVDGLATLLVNDILVAKTRIISGIGKLNFSFISGDKAVITISAENHKPTILNVPILGGCPQANFKIISVDECLSDSFYIENTSNNPNAIFQWNFGQDAVPDTALGAGPFYIHYTSAGPKDISLVMTDSSLSQSSISKSVVVDDFCIHAIPNSGNIITDECYGTLADNGMLGSYTNNVIGSYTISPYGAAHVILTFTELDLQTDFDRINIYDGADCTSPLLLSITANNMPSSPISSTGNSITIEQQTDAQGTGTGFLLNWNCVSAISNPVADFHCSDTISCNADVQFYDNSKGGANQWLWDFGDGTFSNDQHPTHQYLQNGIYSAKLKVSNSFGQDSLLKTNYISISQPLTPQIADQNRCKTGSVTFNSSNNDGTLYWYDQLTNGNLLDTGNSFTTPIISLSKSYFVEKHQFSNSIFCGKSDSTGTGAYSTSNSMQFLEFDVLTNTQLQSVDIYAASSGYRNFYLYNSDGILINATSEFLNVGKNIIDLNWDLAQGFNYRISTSKNNLLYYNIGNANYPYKVGNIVTIKRNNMMNANYFYFYNWKIRSTECISNRIEVKAIISDSLEAIASFAASLNGPTVGFVNESQYADTYYWDFGDGDFSLEKNPSHTYQNTGLYNVSLIAANDCQNSVTHQSVNITYAEIQTAISDNDFKVYPNPTSSEIQIDLNFANLAKSNLSLYNLMGQEIINIPLSNDQQQTLHLNLKSLAKGVYILKLTSNDFTLQKRVIKN